MEKYILLIQTSAGGVARAGDSVEFDGSKLDPKIERELCESLIEALCKAHSMDRSQFDTRLVLKPRDGRAGTGSVSLAIGLAAPFHSGVDQKMLQNFCQKELIDRMPEVHMATTRKAAGEIIKLSTTSVGSTMPLYFGDEIASGNQEEPGDKVELLRDPGALARDVMSQCLVDRLAGKTIPSFRATSGDVEGKQIGSLKVSRPQRRPDDLDDRIVFGYVNSLSRDPPVFEIKASQRMDDMKRTSYRITYQPGEGDETFDRLIDLLKKGIHAKTKFLLKVTVEVGVGVMREKLALGALTLLDDPIGQRSAA